MTAIDPHGIEHLTYDDYLDKQTSKTDIYYLQDEKLARQLVELGYRGSADTLKKDAFLEEKARISALRHPKKNSEKTLCSTGDEKGEFLKALAAREEENMKMNTSTIIFLRTLNKKGQEVSGYIDYAHRLQYEDFTAYFTGEKVLMPRKSDLCYYNWSVEVSKTSDTSNFEVIAGNDGLLRFKNKRDRKIVLVDSKVKENCVRTEVHSDDHIQVVLFDHVLRKKY